MTKFKAGIIILVASASVHAADIEIGAVISPAKHVTASNPSGSPAGGSTAGASTARAPAMGDKLFLGDKVDIGAEERRNVQFRLTDGTFFSCAANTSFTITDYQFENQPTDALKAQITKGGCRILAGNIDRAGAAGQTWGSPTAVMGLAGTLASIVVTPNETAAGIFQGRGHFQSDGKSINLGKNEKFDFATTSVGFQGSLAEPESFAQLQILPTQVEGNALAVVDARLTAANQVAPITQRYLDALEKHDTRGQFKQSAMLNPGDRLNFLGEGIRCE